MNARSVWSRILFVVGSLAMLVGAIDPLEGSVLILPGGGLVALAAFLGKAERRIITYRVWVFVLIAFGVGAMWGLTAVGGFGGPTGRSTWWGVLMLPYLIGYPMGIWGPDSPRWVLVAGIGVGLWYLWLCAKIARSGEPLIIIVVAAVGLLMIGGCIYRLIKWVPRHQEPCRDSAG